MDIALDAPRSASRCRACDAHNDVVAILHALFVGGSEVRAVRWRQRADHFLVDDLVVEFTDGSAFHANAPDPCARTLSPEQYAVLADLMLANTDLLLDAFGVGVTVAATRDAITTTPCPR